VPTDANRPPDRARHVGGVAFATCLVVVLFFADGLPFYFEDVEIIDVALGRSWPQLLAELLDPTHVGERIGYQAQGRPLGLLYLKAMHALAGWSPAVIRLPEVLALSATSGLLAAAIARASGARWVAGLLGLTMGASPALQQSGVWICDFEPMAALLATVVLLLWTRTLGRPPGSAAPWRTVAVLVGITFFAVKMKPGAVVVAPTLVLSSLLLQRRLLLPALVAAGAIGLLVVGPRVSGLGGVGVDPGLWSNVVGFAPMSLRTCALGWAGILFLGVTLVRRRAPEPAPDAPEPLALAAVLAAWGASAAVLWLALPIAEGRYLAGFSVPALACGHLAVASLQSRHGADRPRLVAAAIVVAVASVVPANLARDAAFRGSWGSSFIALDRAAEGAEEQLTNAAVVYRYWRPMLYPRQPERGVEFVWQDRAWAERQGIQFLDNGEVRFPPRFSTVVQLRMGKTANHPAARAFPGVGGLWFDRVSEAVGWEVRNLDLIDLTLDDPGGDYPVTAFLEPWPGR